MSTWFKNDLMTGKKTRFFWINLSKISIFLKFIFTYPFKSIDSSKLSSSVHSGQTFSSVSIENGQNSIISNHPDRPKNKTPASSSRVAGSPISRDTFFSPFLRFSSPDLYDDDDDDSCSLMGRRAHKLYIIIICRNPAEKNNINLTWPNTPQSAEREMFGVRLCEAPSTSYPGDRIHLRGRIRTCQQAKLALDLRFWRCGLVR